jgi:hypothetical protein
LRRGVEQNVDDEVAEQVDLVDVEHVAIRPREQAGTEVDRVALERGLQIDRADDVVDLRVIRQLDDLAANLLGFDRLTASARGRAVGAEVRAVRIAAVRTRRALEGR